jgi:hypothetical protein
MKDILALPALQMKLIGGVGGAALHHPLHCFSPFGGTKPDDVFTPGFNPVGIFKGKNRLSGNCRF